MSEARVLHVIRPATGGMKQHLLDLAAGLAQDGFSVSVAGPRGGEGLRQDIENLGLAYYPVDIAGPLQPGKDLKCVFELYRLIRNHKFDIVHCHGSKAGLVGRLAAWLAGVPVILVTVHNFVVYEEVPLFKRMLFTRGEKFLSRKTSVLITVSRALKAELAKEFGIPDSKLCAIYNGIDLARFTAEYDLHVLRELNGITCNSPVVGTVARMAPQKGLSYFIEAIAMLVKEGLAGTFVIVGDGPLRVEIEAQAEKLGVAGQIFFAGYRPDIVPFLKMFDIFVVPSIAEGLSITTIEAMAAGKPVIASRVGGLPELVKHEHNGLLVPPRDAGALARAMKYLLERPELCGKMGLAGHQMVTADFARETMISKTADLYRRFINKRQHKEG